MEENMALPQLILKSWNSLSGDESQKFRWIQKAIGQNKQSLFLPNNTVYVCRQERAGFPFPCYEMGPKAIQRGVNKPPAFKIPALVRIGIWRDRHSVSTTQAYSVAFYLLNIWPIDFPSWGSSCAATGMWQHTQGGLLLVTKSVLMALSHRFADIGSDRH